MRQISFVHTLCRFAVLVALAPACGTGEPTSTPGDDTTQGDGEALSCNVGAPNALADACGRANSPLAINAAPLGPNLPLPPSVFADDFAYGVHLVQGATNEGVVQFIPALTATYDIYIGTPNIPFRVTDTNPNGPPPAESPTCTSPISSTECNALRKVFTYQLVAGNSYRVEFGPTSAVRYVRLYIQMRVDSVPQCGPDDLTEVTEACAATSTGDTRLDALTPDSTTSLPIALDTVYGVHLPPLSTGVREGVFDFVPASDGDYELYLGTPNIPLGITGDHALVTGTCTRAIPSSECNLLRRGERLRLRAGVSYRFDLGPSATSSYVRVELRRSTESPLAVKLGPGMFYDTGGGGGNLTAADLDGDHALDMVVSYGDDAGGIAQITIMKGSGTGTFARTSTWNTSIPWQTVVGDFTGDGIQDIAGVAWDGQGPLPAFFLRGDGALDYFPSAWGNGRDFERTISSGDFDEDGTPDLVAAYVDDQTNDGPGGFVIMTMPGFVIVQDVPGFGHDTLQAVAGDFNGDGHQDVVIASATTGAIRLYLGDGSGLVTAAQDLALNGGAIREIKAVDLDHDGRADLAVLHARTLNVVHGLATGLSTPETVSFTLQMFGIGAGDFNHDGRTDLVTAQLSDDDFGGVTHMIVLLATDSGFVQTSPGPVVGGFFAVGDFDGDGFDDVATNASGGLVVFLSTP